MRLRNCCFLVLVDKEQFRMSSKHNNLLYWVLEGLYTFDIR
ncbi:MAG: hypothetical protein ACI8QW_001032, partial [Saprospiraceae bacterium]